MLLLLAAAMQAGALEDFQYQGVITQGAVATSDNNVAGDSSDGVSFEFTEVSLNFSKEFGSGVQFAGQGMYRRYGDTYEEVDVDYLIVSKSFAIGPDAITGIRFGRFKNPLGLYNDTRDIAFTRPSVFLPESVYTENFRDLLLSTDGIAAYADLFTENGEWSLELGAGKPLIRSDSQQELDAFQSRFSDDRSVVGRVAYEHDGGRIKGALSYLDLEFDMALSGTVTPPPPAPPFPIVVVDDPGKLDHSRWIASIEYSREDWTVTGEYTLSDFNIYAQTAFPSLDFTNEGYYVAVRKQLTPRWSVYYRWEKFFSDDDDPTGSRFAGSPIPTFSAFRKTHAIGARWDISNNWLLMADYHYNNGTAILSQRDNKPPVMPVKYWHMVAVTLSYRF